MLHYVLREDSHLERLETRHALPLYDSFSVHRDVVSKWLVSYRSMESLAHMHALIASYRERDSRDQATGWGIWLNERPVGLVSLETIDMHSLTATVGCWLVPPAQGRGLGRLAVRAITRYAFAELCLERVGAYVATGNHVSQRLFERVGYRCEGTLRSFFLVNEEAFTDHLAYSLIASEWEARLDLGARVRVRGAAAVDKVWLAPLLGAAPATNYGTSTWVVEREGALVLGVEGAMAWVRAFAIAPASFGRGVGTRLFETAEGEARRRGARVLAVRTESPPQHHTQFLERRGLACVEGGLWVKGV